MTAGGTDLPAAIAIIDTALATADGSTAPSWTRLEARRFSEHPPLGDEGG